MSDSDPEYDSDVDKSEMDRGNKAHLSFSGNGISAKAARVMACYPGAIRVLGAFSLRASSCFAVMMLISGSHVLHESNLFKVTRHGVIAIQMRVEMEILCQIC